MAAYPGIAHKYAEKLIAFEHGGTHSGVVRETGKEKEKEVPHTLLWIGGLGDGLCTVE